jgi:hypothetical protein
LPPIRAKIAALISLYLRLPNRCLRLAKQAVVTPSKLKFVVLFIWRIFIGLKRRAVRGPHPPPGGTRGVNRG